MGQSERSDNPALRDFCLGLFLGSIRSISQRTLGGMILSLRLHSVHYKSKILSGKGQENSHCSLQEWKVIPHSSAPLPDTQCKDTTPSYHRTITIVLIFRRHSGNHLKLDLKDVMWLCRPHCLCIKLLPCQLNSSFVQESNVPSQKYSSLQSPS